MGRKAIVIGAGIGGMASAIRMANLGFDTEVYESNAFPGGKINSKKIGAYRFDMGPSVFTEPHLVEELLRINMGKTPEFDFIKLPTSCHYFFEDGSMVSLPSGSEKVAEAFQDQLGEDKKLSLAYLEMIRKNYEAVYPVFISASLHRFRQWMNKGVFWALARIPKYGLFRTMNAVNKGYFKNKKTVQILNRFATYNGSSPYRSSGLLNVIAHLELNIGPYLPKGGMVSISKTVYEKAVSMGVKFNFNQKIEEILFEGNQVSGIRSNMGTEQADIIISNMDVHYTYEKLMPGMKAPKKILNQEKSTSALVFYWGIKKKFPELDVHNIFFSDEYSNEFKYLFDKGDIINDPTVYIHVSSKIESADAPGHGENWFVMVNAPINEGQNWNKLRDRTRTNVLRKLSGILGDSIEDLIEEEDYTDPVRMEDFYSGKQGSIYGNSSNSRMAAFYRHPNFSNQFRGLYFAGVTVHPGGGIPLALNSAKIIERCIRKDFSVDQRS